MSANNFFATDKSSRSINYFSKFVLGRKNNNAPFFSIHVNIGQHKSLAEDLIKIRLTR